MPITYNGTNITAINYNGTALTKVIFNGTTVWESASWHTVWSGSVANMISSTSYTTYSFSVSGLRTLTSARITGYFLVAPSFTQESFTAITYFNGTAGVISSVSVSNASTLNVTAYKKATMSPTLYITKIEQYY